jgi:uncharacterized membrane protein YciS (DUF1049 family)
MALAIIGLIVCAVFLYVVFKNVQISEKRDEKILKRMTKRKNKK